MARGIEERGKGKRMSKFRENHEGLGHSMVNFLIGANTNLQTSEYSMTSDKKVKWTKFWTVICYDLFIHSRKPFWLNRFDFCKYRLCRTSSFQSWPEVCLAGRLKIAENILRVLIILLSSNNEHSYSADNWGLLADSIGLMFRPLVESWFRAI